MAKTEAKETPIGEVMLLGVRLSFADLYEPGKPQKNDDGETVPGKYKANFLMEKNTPLTKQNRAKIDRASAEVKKKKWGDEKNWPKFKPEKVCVRDGDLESWEGYEGHIYLSANNKDQPQLISRRKDAKGKWIPAKPGELYSGCYVNALVRLWAQDHEKHGKRINATVEVVQFDRHGEAFGGGAPIDPNEKFSEIEEDEGESLGYDGSSEDEDEEIAGLI